MECNHDNPNGMVLCIVQEFISTSIVKYRCMQCERIIFKLNTQEEDQNFIKNHDGRWENIEMHKRNKTAKKICQHQYDQCEYIKGNNEIEIYNCLRCNEYIHKILDDPNDKEFIMEYRGYQENRKRKIRRYCDHDDPYNFMKVDGSINLYKCIYCEEIIEGDRIFETMYEDIPSTMTKVFKRLFMLKYKLV